MKQCIATCNLKIVGMVRMTYVSTIEGHLSKEPGIAGFNVSIENESAEITYDPMVTSVEKICKAIEEMGFDACEEDDKNESLKETVIYVEGMTCMSCVNNIESMIGDRPGVHSIHVSLGDKTASITYLPDIETVDTLIEAISDMGFDASYPDNNENKKVVIDIVGMTCNSCVQSIEKMISAFPGVVLIKVSLEKNNADVIYDPNLTTADCICGEVDDMGFDASIARSSELVL